MKILPGSDELISILMLELMTNICNKVVPAAKVEGIKSLNPVSDPIRTVMRQLRKNSLITLDTMVTTQLCKRLQESSSILPIKIWSISSTWQGHGSVQHQIRGLLTYARGRQRVQKVPGCGRRIIAGLIRVLMRRAMTLKAGILTQRIVVSEAQVMRHF